MPKLYRYRALTGEGQKIKGQIRAASRQDAALKLENQGLYPFDLNSKAKGSFFTKRLPAYVLKITGFNSCNSRDLMIFCRQLATMLKAGIPVLRALNLLSRQLESKSFRRNLQEAAISIEKGASFAEALAGQKGYFPQFLISMVEAGEAGGVLDLVMDRSAEHFEKQHDLEEKIRSATTYPLFVSFVALVVIAVMLVFVLPRFAFVFSQMGVDLPFYSQWLLGLGEVISTKPLLFIAPKLFTVLVTLFALQTKSGRLFTDHLKFKLPFYTNIYKKIVAARFARTLSTLIASGLTLQQALPITGRVIDNAKVSSTLKRIEKALQEGESLAEPLLKSKVFPPLLAEMVRTGEETGSLDFTLEKTALYYEKEVAYIADRLGTILEPLLLLVVGLFVGLIVFSVLSPMFSMFELF